MDFIYDLLLIKEVVYPIIIILVGFLVYFIVSRTIKGVFKSKISKVEARHSKSLCNLINKILKYLIIIFCVLAILEVFGISTSGIITSLGAVGVVVGLAFQDTLKDILAGFSIIFENKYAVGDIITVGTFKGKVIHLGLKSTKIQSINGEIKIVSNSSITEVINHNLDDSFEFVDIPVSYDASIEKVEEILLKICEKLEKENEDLIETQLLGLEAFDSSSVNFRVMLKTKTMKQYIVKREFLKLVKLEFDKEKIEIPYQQVVVHNARI